MISNKVYVLGSCFNTVHTLSPGAVTCNTSSRCLSNRDIRFRNRRHGQERKHYATVANDSGHDGEQLDPGDLHWPDAPRGHSCPTPYQIFAIAKTAPYSKTRFYELVKIYHPDRNGTIRHDTSGQCSEIVSHATKLERYRLIVAAHTILSDPVKRSAYDRWGAGWEGRTETGATWARNHAAHGQPGPFTTSWRERADGNIWANATWEDWERWREKHESHGGQTREAQSPLFMKNSAFVSVIMMLAAVGSSWNYNRAEAEGGRFLAARDAVHDQASKELRKVRQVTNQRPKDERIDWFVKNREASLLGIGVDEVREERARHVLPSQEGCLSEDVRSKG
ncbi:hypothetical protein ANO11243_011750 [Dothideomycetidae sp. 11243]|nr:hypothetical protein ANO11243_011750 [fungal sp. No.11243]